MTSPIMKLIRFQIKFVHGGKIYITTHALGSSLLAYEILDALDDVMNEQIHVSQIISVERLADE